LLLEKANALAEKWDKIPIVLAGDFNSTPDVCFYFLDIYGWNKIMCSKYFVMQQPCAHTNIH